MRVWRFTGDAGTLWTPRLYVSLRSGDAICEYDDRVEVFRGDEPRARIRTSKTGFPSPARLDPLEDTPSGSLPDPRKGFLPAMGFFEGYNAQGVRLDDGTVILHNDLRFHPDGWITPMFTRAGGADFEYLPGGDLRDASPYFH